MVMRFCAIGGKNRLVTTGARRFYACCMKIRKLATVTLLVLSSFAATSVAPSKTELESMYDKAFREFDANNYAEALKDLDAIDARQPDLAESQNLRGVIMMRQADYAKAETALQKALAADPKFWNARFNLAEIPFLQKNWPEARKRFQGLLSGNAAELQGEATQLIQYKILLTYLLEGKANMVQSLMAKFELSPDAPAVHYANAAIALNKKDDAEAKNWLSKAEKSFSPQLNKLFAESLYEVGWLEKPAGQTRAALELNSAAQTKAFADSKFEQAEQALQQRDFTAARKLADEADTADPNQPRILNLRGEILLEQKDYDGAENEFHKALKIDGKFRDAQYNLAQVPFKKKEYAKARDRFESLFSVTTGADKDQAAQLIKFKIFLTLLLEGKDSRAQKMMEQFQFTGDTPALYYAQAASEFKNNNTAKANEWVTSARKIYSPALNGVFSESFYDIGWLQTPALAASPAPMIAEADQPAENAPAIEPTPIPSMTLAQNGATNAEPLSLAQANAPVSGMEATTSSDNQSPASAAVGADRTDNAATVAASSPSVETPVASTAPAAAAKPIVANAEPATSDSNESTTAAAVASTPATVLAPAQVRAWAGSSWVDRLNDRDVVPGAMLVAGILLLLWVVIAQLRRHLKRTSQSRGSAPAPAAPFEDDSSVGAIERLVRPAQFAGGPPRVSLQLRASEPAVRKAAMPVGKSGRFAAPEASAAAPSASPSPVEAVAEPQSFVPPVPESLDEGVGEPVEMPEQTENWYAPAVEAPVQDEAAATPEFVSEPAPIEMGAAAAGDETAHVSAPVDDSSDFAAPADESASVAAVANEEPLAVAAEIPPAVDEATLATIEPISEVEDAVGEASPQEVSFAEPATTGEATAAAEPSVQSVTAPEALASVDAPISTDAVAEEPAAVAEEPSTTPEPIGQGQPVPYQIAASADESPRAEAPAPQAQAARPSSGPVSAILRGLAGIGALRHSVATSAAVPEIITNEPTAQQPTTPEIMAQPTQPTPAPVIRTGPPTQPGAAAPQGSSAMQSQAPQSPMPQPGGGGMHTAVQLTFSFEIASLQLTPTFKMGALQLRPTSKIVTMRLAPSQHPQPAMNLQVTFEIASVQLNGSAIGTVRLTPSQQQRPGITSTPSFNIAGLQLVSGADAAPVQLTPSTQGQASVLVTGGFQIATVEFSPSFEIASIILNSTSRTVNVQLPGNGPSAVEAAPVFEIGNVQISGNGEIGMMQLNPQVAGAKRA